MVQESKKYLFSDIYCPSKKKFLISIPMLMYRIQSNQFSGGLNFFQNTVLKILQYPSINNAKIASLLNIGESLVNLIVQQLQSQGLVSVSGAITHKGKDALLNSDGLIVNDTQRQVGYVFSYGVNQEFFPYYQNKIQFADVVEQNLSYTTDTGTHEIDDLFMLDSSFETYKVPGESQIIQLMRNTSHLSLRTSNEEQLLKIRFIPNEEPDLVNVCTYVYLPEGEDDTYENDWQVLNPFANDSAAEGENSYELKLYLQTLLKANRKLKEKIIRQFGDAETSNRRSFLDSEKWLTERVAEEIDQRIDTSIFSKTDINLQDSLRFCVEYYLRMKESNFSRKDHSQMFFINMQSALETILLLDQEERKEIYEDTKNNLGGRYVTQGDRQLILSRIYQKKILSTSTQIPDVLNKKTQNWHGRSLLDYLLKFMYTLAYEEDLSTCPIIEVFKNRIDMVINVAQARNIVGHGHTEHSHKVQCLTQESAELYYNFIFDIVVDYIKIF